MSEYYVAAFGALDSRRPSEGSTIDVGLTRSHLHRGVRTESHARKVPPACVVRARLSDPPQGALGVVVPLAIDMLAVHRLVAEVVRTALALLLNVAAEVGDRPLRCWGSKGGG
jgi:hypothetical protein